MQESLSLFELNEHIRRVMALNFPESLWIRAEIAQLNEKRGNIYIELVEKDSITNDIIAQSSAMIWQRQFKTLVQKHGKMLQSVFQEGIEILLKVSVNFHERYSLSLTIEDVDLSFTLGKLAMVRIQTLEFLQQKNLLYKQKKHILSPVLQRIAVITSEKAAGWADFSQHIKENPFGYDIQMILFDSTMQGQFAANDIIQQLVRVKFLHAQKPFDAVVITRGGGSKIDLMAFDDQAMNEAIANFPVPILAGVGHEIDETVLDYTAFLSLKTPTAVAEYILHTNARFEATLLQQEQVTQSIFKYFLEKNNNFLKKAEQDVLLLQKIRFSEEHQKLNNLEKTFQRNLQFSFQSTLQQLSFFEKIAAQNNPENILKKGFSITKYNGKIVKNVDDVKKGDEIETILVNGKIKSRIE